MQEIFVFGSNTEGKHGKGAALEALKYHDAIYGIPRGLQGNSYAIVTKNLKKGLKSIPLRHLYNEIQIFIGYAKGNSNYIFNVTPIGCGLAGYTPEEIAPMFRDCPTNVKLPQVFLDVLNK